VSRPKSSESQEFEVSFEWMIYREEAYFYEKNHVGQIFLDGNI
jgi:hypothetical protein